MADFEFQLPVSGKKIGWRPLNVGQQLDLAQAFQGPAKVQLTAAMYAARIFRYQTEDGKDKPSCSIAEIKQWDEIDYNLFSEEVDRREAERYHAFKPKEDPRVASARLQKAVSDAKDAFVASLKCLDEAVEAAKAAELASAAPLSAGQS